MTSADNNALLSIAKDITKVHLALANPYLSDAHHADLNDTLDALNELRISLLEAKYS